MEKSNEKVNNYQKRSFQQRFPITKPQICSSNPKFPYRDIRHYIDPCCDFPKECQYGYTAQISIEHHQPNVPKCQSPELPTSHPWFTPSSPQNFSPYTRRDFATDDLFPQFDISSCVICLIAANHRMTNSKKKVDNEFNL